MGISGTERAVSCYFPNPSSARVPMKSGNENHILEAAYGIIVADGCFGLAFTLHLLGLPAGGLTLFDYAAAGILVSVFLSACWVIHDLYWQMKGGIQKNVVKMLRIK